MHRTAIVIKLSRLSPDSSSVSWWLARVLVRDRKAPEHPGLWLVLRNLIWPLIGRDKPAALLSFSVRDMTLWWSKLSRPSHINSPVLSAAAAPAQTPSCRQWVMSWWAWHRAVAVRGPVTGNEGNHMNYDPHWPWAPGHWLCLVFTPGPALFGSAHSRSLLVKIPQPRVSGKMSWVPRSARQGSVKKSDSQKYYASHQWIIIFKGFSHSCLSLYASAWPSYSVLVLVCINTEQKVVLTKHLLDRRKASSSIPRQ